VGADRLAAPAGSLADLYIVSWSVEPRVFFVVPFYIAVRSRRTGRRCPVSN
jgi:hypothetical protein